jgi:hypothetical protein
VGNRGRRLPGTGEGRRETEVADWLAGGMALEDGGDRRLARRASGRVRPGNKASASALFFSLFLVSSSFVQMGFF